MRPTGRPRMAQSDLNATLSEERRSAVRGDPEACPLLIESALSAMSKRVSLRLGPAWSARRLFRRLCLAACLAVLGTCADRELEDPETWEGWLSSYTVPKGDRGPRSRTERLLRLNRVDQAVAELSSSLLEDDWRALNDLSVVLLRRAGTHERPLDYVRALDFARRALRRAGEEPSVLFNNSLVAAKLGLHNQASGIWQKLGTNGQEAVPPAKRARLESELAALQPTRAELWTATRHELLSLEPWEMSTSVRRRVAEFPYQARLFAIHGLIPELIREPSRASSRSHLALAIGETLAFTQSDWTVLDTWRWLLDCRAVGGARQDDCDEATLAFLEGYQSFYGSQPKIAQTKLRFAAAKLAELGSPLSGWARFFQVYSLFHEDVPKAINDLQSELRNPLLDRYPSLRGRLHWRLGVGFLLQGLPEQALAEYRKGSFHLDCSSGRDGAIFGSLLEAEALIEVGDVESSWALRLRALRGVVLKGERRQIHSTLGESIRALLRQGLTAAAEGLVEEFRAYAVAWNRLDSSVDSYRRLAELLVSKGDLDEASRVLEQARLLSGKLGDSAVHRMVAGYIELLQSQVTLTTDAAEALAAASRSAESAEEIGDPQRLRLALVARADAKRLLGDKRGAAEDLGRALDWVERIRNNARMTHRESAFRFAQPIVDRQLDLLIDQGRCTEAFDVLEQFRARTLLDMTVAAGSSDSGEGQRVLPKTRPGAGASGFVAQVLSLSAVQPLLEPTTQLLSWALLEDSTVFWVLGRKSTECVRLPFGRKAVRAAAADLQKHKEGGLRPWSEALDRLSARLLEPSLLAEDPQAIVLVPDRELQRIPLALLRHPRGGRLIERSAVVYSPSASLLRPHERRTSDGPPVIVSTPDLSQTPWAGLPPLPGARHEVEAILTSFSTAKRLEGAAANRASILSWVPEAPWLHFAAHAVVNVDAPHRSRLPVSDSDLNEDAVTTNIARSGVGLVFLSACRTLDGFDADREGPLGYSGVLFAQGVPSVVSTLWPANDQAGVPFVGEFYELLADGLSVSRAFRSAMQSQLRKAPGSIRDLGNFVLMSRELSHEEQGE